MLALVGSRTGPSHSPDAIGTTPENAGANSFDEIWMALVTPAETTAMQPDPATDQGPRPDDVSVEEDGENQEVAHDEPITEQEPLPTSVAEPTSPQPHLLADAADPAISGTTPIKQEHNDPSGEQPPDQIASPTAATQLSTQMGVTPSLPASNLPMASAMAAPPVVPAQSPVSLRTAQGSVLASAHPTGAEAATVTAKRQTANTRVKSATPPEPQAFYRTERSQPKSDTPAGSNISQATAVQATFTAAQPTNTDAIGAGIAAPSQTAPAAIHALPETLPEGTALAGARSGSPQHAHTVDNSAHIGSPVARNIASQIIAQLTPIEPGVTEITLSPEELGKLQLSVTTRDGIVAIVMMAERPETNDLLRRHMDALAQDFRAAGIDQLDLSMGDLGRDRSAQPDHDETVTIAAETPLDNVASGTRISETRAQILLNDRLDLRM